MLLLVTTVRNRNKVQQNTNQTESKQKDSSKGSGNQTMLLLSGDPPSKWFLHLVSVWVMFLGKLELEV
ncbi:hypothetical protein QQP08_014165 [Theobroma cacao]|nr:hypothetical protein QQP08_014165 [Theobroma cacao]